jgi:uncharacterized protein (TIGR00288 family)
MNVTDNRSRIAVFIDFDNVEIGVKSTIGGQFDIGLVLEAIKERGEIVTKIAYSDWKRAGDYSRLLTQHAIRMVQRNLTPGGDKNGADITMALDALEMAFTHDHINAFVIVGGDSDFISLVEKLKQYGRRVIVVGGRQFTSMTMQKNCHEFIAYENLVESTRAPRRQERGSGKPVAADGADIAKVLPLVRRALKVLSEREVTPQLGVLKSTLLQLDSTFSEREYGAGSFRDFMEKVARAGAVTLKHAGRSMLVEAVEEGDPAHVESEAAAPSPPAERQEPKARTERPPRPEQAPRREPPPRVYDVEDDEEMPASPMGMADGVRAVQQAFAAGTPRWPMYIRQAKQYLKNTIENFDERKYGFASVVDLLRAAAKVGVVRVERDRQGGMRVFPGAALKAAPATDVSVSPDVGEVLEAPPAVTDVTDPQQAIVEEVAAEPPIVDGEIAVPDAASATAAAEGEAVGAAPGEETGRRSRKRSAKTARPAKHARKREPKAAKAARPRARKSARSKSEAADNA